METMSDAVAIERQAKRIRQLEDELAKERRNRNAQAMEFARQVFESSGGLALNSEEAFFSLYEKIRKRLERQEE